MTLPFALDLDIEFAQYWGDGDRSLSDRGEVFRGPRRRCPTMYLGSAAEVFGLLS